MNGMSRIVRAAEVPSGEHFAVLVYKTESTFIEGDERSRTNPGHGYPAHYETRDIVEHWVTTDKETLKQFVYDKHKEGIKDLVFFKVEKLGSFKVEVNVDVVHLSRREPDPYR